MSPNNLRLLLAYDGSNYSGWQRQDNAVTIQGMLEERLATMTGCPVKLFGAGRTDAGVHALGMVSNFHTASTIPMQGFLKGLNSMLPADIRVLEVNREKHRFHSRYDATGKTYRYDIFTGRIQLPTERLYTAHIPWHLDIDVIRSCLQRISGAHDFSSFEAGGSRDPNRTSGRGAVRTLYQATLFADPNRDQNWSFRFTGDGFLRHMVRNLVGTLIEAGSGKITVEEFITILENRDRTKAGPTAPAHGLFLEKVLYRPINS